MKNYRFTITELSLTSNKYPFDFFIRINSSSTGEFWETQNIECESFAISEKLPWKFVVSTDKLIL